MRFWHFGSMLTSGLVFVAVRSDISNMGGWAAFAFATLIITVASYHNDRTIQ